MGNPGSGAISLSGGPDAVRTARPDHRALRRPDGARYTRRDMKSGMGKMVCTGGREYDGGRGTETLRAVKTGTEAPPGRRGRSVPREITDLLRRPDDDEGEGIARRRRIADAYARNAALLRLVPAAAERYAAAEAAYARAVAPRLGAGRSALTDLDQERRAAEEAAQQSSDTAAGDADYAQAKMLLGRALASIAGLTDALRAAAADVEATGRPAREDDRPQFVRPFSLSDVADRAFGADRSRRL